VKVFAVTLLLFSVVGCGYQAANHPKSKGSPAKYVTVGARGLSLRVPSSWRNHVELTTAAANGHLSYLLPRTGAAYMYPLSLSPKNASPFFEEQMEMAGASGGNASLQLFEIGSDGIFYTLQINVPLTDAAELRKVASTAHIPPVATATDVVQFMSKTPEANVISRTAVGPARWELVGGNVGTAQEEFALYESTDGGTTWTLERWTHGSSEFMGLAGAAAVYFWTPQDGIIAESSDFSNRLQLFRSTDGGRTWSTVPAPLLGHPDGVSPPTISRNPNGSLTITARTVTGSHLRIVSTDGGLTWVSASTAASSPGS